MSLILLRFARPHCLAATHLSSPEVGNGLSWPKPQCTCNAMVTSQTQHSTNEGVLRSNSACSMLMSDDLRLPRRGIEPRPSGFRDIDSTSRPSPLLIRRSLGPQFKPKRVYLIWVPKIAVVTEPLMSVIGLLIYLRMKMKWVYHFCPTKIVRGIVSKMAHIFLLFQKLTRLAI